jgi:hypothetical protein
MKIAFLLGSGFSIPAGVPGTSEITEQIIFCENVHRHSDGLYFRGHDPNASINDSNEYLRRIGGLIQIVKEEIENYYFDESWADYERIYYIIRQIHDSERGELDNPVVQAFIDKIRPRTTGLLVRKKGETLRLDLLNMASEALNYITCQVRSLLYSAKWKTDYLDINLGKAIEDTNLDIDIFNLNHDEVLEQFLERKGSNYVDGFSKEVNGVRYWASTNYIGKALRLRLFKLHGSINWYEFSNGVGIPLDRDPWHSRNPEGGLQLPDLSRPGLLVILIGTFNKMLEYTHGVFADLYYLFRSRLKRANRLIICGYGFGDKGINNSIIEWFNSNQQNKVIVIDPDEEGLRERARPAARRFLFPEIVEQGIRDNDFILTGDPNSGVTERPTNPLRKWEIIPWPIEVTSWEMIKKAFRKQ